MRNCPAPGLRVGSRRSLVKKSRMFIGEFTLMSLLLISLFVYGGCGDALKAKSAAETAVGEFHQMYNEYRNQEIYENAHSDFRGSSNYEQFESFVSALQVKLGQVMSTETRGWKVNSTNFVTTAILQQETHFELGEALETFTFRVNGQKAVLLGYNINSRDLIMN
jgi:hypothetical protein